MCEGSDLSYWPDEQTWVFLAASSHCGATVCEMNTWGISNNFSFFSFVTSIRASCWSAVGTRLIKSGRRSMSHCPTMAYCPITPALMWVSMPTKHFKALWCRIGHRWLVVDGSGWCLAWQDYMLNTPGKEMDLLRVTVKVPGKRPPRAAPACGAPAGLNGRVKDVTGPEGFSPGKRVTIFSALYNVRACGKLKF